MLGNRYGGIFINCFTANLLKNQPVKEFWKSVKIWQTYDHEYGVPPFIEHCVVAWRLLYILDSHTTCM